MASVPPPSQRGSLTRRDVERIVDDALEDLPEWVLDQIDNLTVVVEDWPTPQQDPDGGGVLGLYEGVSLEERGVDYFAASPDRITVFRGPHMALGLNRADTAAEIRRTVYHEIAHHIGIDDARLHDLGWD